MAMSQAQYLLMLAEDARARGDELSEEMSRRGRAHALEVLELAQLIDRAKDIIEREKSRFAQYLPRQAGAGQLAGAGNQAPPNALPHNIVRKAAAE